MKNFGTESLKEKLLPEMEKLIQNTLSSWSKEKSINIGTAIVKMTFIFVAKQFNMAKDLEGLSKTFVHFMKCLMSFPLNIPGTAFNDSLKKKDLRLKVMKEKLHEKLNSPKAYQGDLLDELINDMKTESFLTEELAIRLVLGSLFTSSMTISMSLTLAIKLLYEHPSVVDELWTKHEEVLSKREPAVPLTWGEYKSRTFTLQVIQEVLRLTNPLPGFFCNSKKDIQFKGYTIPQGWTILLASSVQHLNPDTYDDPLAVNPHRWKELDSSFSSKSYMPFGAGERQCSGAEYAKAFKSTFLHVLCTKYRWTKVKGGENISRKPHLDFGEGIHINVSKLA